MDNFSGKKILILGAGVTGLACARSLQSRGAEIALADDNIESIQDFRVAKPETFNIGDWDSLLISPGLKHTHPLIQSALNANIELLNEIDVAWDIRNIVSPGQRWVAVTGTNGKTTTVEMTAAMISESGVTAIACGNVGETVIECVERVGAYDVLVLELSSFQLHWLRKAQFICAAILNIADDHLDWHGSFDAYAHDKISLLDHTPIAILNADDSEVVTRTLHWQGRKIFFSTDTPMPGELGVVEDLIVDRAFVPDPQEAAALASILDIKPTVPHSVSNALAASGIARCLGVSPESIESALQKFTLGRHRIEKVHESKDVIWIDDSKATNPHAAAASLLSAFSVIWIAGGLAKGAKMEELISRTKSRIKTAILIGQDRQLIADQLRSQAPHVEILEVDPPQDYHPGGESNSFMEAVVRTAQSRAKPGDTVLLAPACASMDQFISYGDRGDRFTAAVKKEITHG